MLAQETHFALHSKDLAILGANGEPYVRRCAKDQALASGVMVRNVRVKPEINEQIFGRTRNGRISDA